MNSVAAQIAAELESFISNNSHDLHSVSPDFELIETELQAFLAGGKRLRPLFATAGYLSTAEDLSPELPKVIAALELIQASALIHDDLMDASATRRGRETIHRRFARLHKENNWQGDAAAFGSAAAILIGNLCLVWADKMFFENDFDAARLLSAKPYFDAMRVEVMAGQYLDVMEQNRRTADLSAIANIVNFKTAKYTVERPLHIGALLAGAKPEVVSMLSRFATPIGAAFQYRDDLLGAFGESAVTGKPVGDDFREGKRTLLIALFHETASTPDWTWFESVLGQPKLSDEEVYRAQTMLQDAGVVEKIEHKISALHTQALAELETSDISSQSRDWLIELSHAALYRSK